MNVSPIALFVYNRPHHTRETIQHLLNNHLASESILYIYSDAPKNPDAADAVHDVREYIHGIGGFRSVTVIERKDNYGLSKSIIDGITQLCSEFGRVIVLEDDISVSPKFLDYMNTTLDIYKNEERVMHVSGYMFPVREADKLPESFFYRGASCWGWATWQRAWRVFEYDAEKLLQQIRGLKREYDFDILGTMNYTRMLQNQVVGKIDSWAIRWYANIFLRSGLCLHPARSLVRNIGHDGTGVHCNISDAFDVEVSQYKVVDFPSDITESDDALQAMADFYRSLRKPLHKRFLKLLFNKV